MPLTKAQWLLYRDLVRIVFAAMNKVIELDDPIQNPVGQFPPGPKGWRAWADAALDVIGAMAELKITDEAFKQVAGLLTASETLAATFVVPEPSAEHIKKVQTSLERINEAVKADGRFHAALDIGVAVSKEIKTLAG